MYYVFTSGAPKGPEIQSHDYFPELDPKLPPKDWGNSARRIYQESEGTHQKTVRNRIREN